MHLRRTLPLLAGLLALLPLNAQPSKGPDAQAARGIDPANLDPSVKPCDDFFRYANGGWLSRNALPADKSRWGSMDVLGERNRLVLREILETCAKGTWEKGSLRQKLGDFYASGMDEAAIEKAGTAPLEPRFKRIAALSKPAQLPALLADLTREGSGAGFGLFVAQDPTDTTRYTIHLSQGGLGLPDRDYYLKEDARSRQLRDQYQAHVARMLVLAGQDEAGARKDAATILALETRLAKAHFTRVENRDPRRVCNKRTQDELAAQAKGFDWKAYFKALGVPAGADMNVRQPSFLQEFSTMAAAVPMADWKAYLRWHVVSGMAPALPKAFGDESFSFFGKVLNGTPQQEDRWKRVQAATDRALGEALGQMYVERAFSAESKRRMHEMVENLREALRVRIGNLDWMSQETKKNALVKLAAFKVKVGYPDVWRDYSALRIERSSYAENLQRAQAFEFQRRLSRLGKPIDRTEWNMTPATVNAYYSPLMNEIVFPAGILQPPFFDPNADDACNYGAIGTVIGHEMTHGFDDSGSQYDASGNLRNWWTDADRAAYQSRTELMVKQFDAYEALPGAHINGKLTVGENIADLGGLKIAFAAWRKAQEGKAQGATAAAPAPDGFTPKQRFFLAYAGVWRGLIRDEALRLRLATDPHSPGRFRVLGPLSNLPEFFEAFSCGEGMSMCRPAALRPSVW